MSKTALQTLAETIKAHTGKDLGDSYNMCGGTTLTQLIVKAMESYHASKLSEVKGLPTYEEVQDYCSPNVSRTAMLSGANWMRSIAQQVIAKKDEELNKAKEEIEGLKGDIKMAEKSIDR